MKTEKETSHFFFVVSVLSLFFSDTRLCVCWYVCMCDCRVSKEKCRRWRSRQCRRSLKIITHQHDNVKCSNVGLNDVGTLRINIFL